MTDDRKYIRIFYTIIAFITFFKFSLSSITTGLDVSWVYAINRFFNKGVLWGHDVMFTYGPLGFIICPMNIGSNAIISLAYWIFMAVSSGLIFSYIFFSECNSVVSSRKNNILISLTLFYLGSCVFGRLSSEYVTTFMILCLLSLCWNSDEFKFFFMASLLCVFSMFIKFNSGIVNFMILVMFSLVFHPAKYMTTLIITPALFVLCFMIYNPSFSELIYYVRGVCEISSGYMSAMSTSFFLSKSFALMMTAMFIIYAFILFVILKKSEFFDVRHSMRYAMIFAVPFFGEFKHAFTRSGGGHNFSFMPVIYVYISAYILFMKGELNVSKAFSKFLKYSLCAIFCVSFILSSLGINKLGIWPKMAVYHASTNPLFEFYDNAKSFMNSSSDNREVKLPSEFLSIISNDTATIYPMEISLAEDIPNYKSMPIFQAYSAYTSWLDEQNAEFYSDNDAPKFIVFNTEAIDERFPLIECPQTWYEIFRHYEVTLHDTDKHMFLLERRASRKLESHEISTRTYSRDDVINIPAAKGLCVMNADMKLNLMGRFMKLAYKIPAVMMTVEFDDGRIITKRVIADSLQNDTIISNLILDDNDFEQFMNGDLKTGRVKSIQFSGDGLKYYASNIAITFTELTE